MALDALPESIMRQVHKTESGCWDWQGCKTRSGHGQIRWRGKVVSVHRLAYELVNNVHLDSTVVVCHVCDRASCVRPSHLTAGSHQANRADCVAKGRHARGETHGKAKLTWEKVGLLRRWWRKGLATQGELARLFGVSERAVRYIVQEQHWRTA